MSSNQDTTPPPASSVMPSATNTSVSSLTGNSANRGGNNRRYNQGGRSAQCYVTKQDDYLLFNVDKSYGAVVGGPSENRHLKYGKPYQEFVETMREYRQ